MFQPSLKQDKDLVVYELCLVHVSYQDLLSVCVNRGLCNQCFCFDFFFFLAVVCSMWDLSSLTRHQTHAMPPALEEWCFNHQTTREIPQ